MSGAIGGVGAGSFHTKATAHPGPFPAQESYIGAQEITTGSRPPLDKNHPDIKELSRFFGEPNLEFLNTTRARDEYDVEVYDYPDAFRGSSTYLRAVLLRQITHAEEFTYRVLAPLKKHDGSLTVTWDQMRYNSHMLSRVPEEGVSRLVSSNHKSGTESLQRVGIAALFEHGFQKTEQGRRHYINTMMQLRAAAQMTLALGVMVRYVNVVSGDSANKKYRPIGNNSLVELDRRIQVELDNWAIVQQGPDGWERLMKRFRKGMIEAGESSAGNITIMPAGSRDYARDAYAERTEFQYTGLPGGTPLPLADDSTVHESRDFPMGEHEPDYDPVFTTRTIGGFSLMVDHHLQSIPPEEFRTRFMNTFIYDENQDQYASIDLKTAMVYSGLYHHPRNSKSFYKEDNSRAWDTSLFGKNEVNNFTDHYWNCLLAAEEAEQDRREQRATGLAGTVYEDSVEKLRSNVHAVQKQRLRWTWYEAHVQAGNLNNTLEAVLALNDDNFLSFLQTFDKTFSTDAKQQMAEEYVVQFENDRTEWVNEGKSQTHVYYTNRSMLIAQLENAIEAATMEALDAALDQAEKFVQSPTYQNVGRNTDTKASAGERLTNFFGMNKPKQSAVALKAAKNAKHINKNTGRSNNDVGGVLEGSLESMSLFNNSVQTFLSKIDQDVERSGLAADSLAVTELKNALTTLSQDDDTATSSISIAQLASQLSPELIGLDRDIAVCKAREKYAARGDDSYLTPVEQLISTSDCHGIVKARDLAAVDTLRWSCGKGKLVNGADNHLPIPLATYSDALTFTANHAVLFDLTDAQYNEFVNNQGKIKINTRDEDSLHMFAPRLAKLQFSVAMSAVFKALKPLIASGSFDSEAVEQLNLAQLVSSQHPLGEGYDLMADLDDANARFAQPLLTQYVLTDVIGNLQLIVKHLLAGPGADASDEEKEQYNGTLANLAERMYFDWLFAKQVPKNADAIEYQLTDDWDHVSQASLLHSLDRSIDAAAIQKLEDEAAKLMADYRKDLQSSIESATDEQQEAELNQMDANLLRWFSLLMGVYVVTKQRCTNANDHFSKNNFLRRVKSILRTQAIDDINAGQIANEVAIALTAVSPTAAQTAIREYVSSDEGARGATAGAAYASYVSGVQAQIKDQSDYRDQLIKVASTVNNNITNYVVTGVASSGDNMDLDQTSDDRNALGGPSSALDTVSQTLVSGLKRYRNHAYIVKVMKTMSLNNGCWLFFCYEMNIPPAVGAMLARNAKEYSTGTAIHTFSGGKTGNTYYGQCDFMLADNANQKMHFGHFTMNSKTIIHRPDLVLHAYNCYVNDYLGGNGSSFWDAMDEQDRADFNLGVAAHDIIVIPIPVNSTTSRRHVSMSGRYSSQLNASEDLQELLDYDFPTLKAAAAYWGFVDSYQSITAQHTPVANSLRNMLLFQEHQLLYRYQGKNKGDFGFAVRETGHWGETVFPGCAKIHRGQGKYLVPRGENTVTGVFAR